MDKQIEPSPMRPSRDKVLIETAMIWSKRSTCSRLAVGCVISRDGRILVQGYNGAPSGMPHCVHVIDEPCITAEHAERNAIAWAARNGVKLEGAEMHVTTSPCLSCAMAVVNVGIIRVRWLFTFRDEAGIQLLTDAKVDGRIYAHD